MNQQRAYRLGFVPPQLQDDLIAPIHLTWYLACLHSIQAKPGVGLLRHLVLVHKHYSSAHALVGWQQGVGLLLVDGDVARHPSVPLKSGVLGFNLAVVQCLRLHCTHNWPVLEPEGYVQRCFTYMGGFGGVHCLGRQVPLPLQHVCTMDTVGFEWKRNTN